MIELYTWSTPNGYKVPILLEELEVPYKVIPIDITRRQQFEPSFLKISPNNKIPAIIDTETPEGKPYSLFESGAILMYLAEKFNRFLPQDISSRYQVIQWLMFQMASVGPMLGQSNHFKTYAPESIPYAIERYSKEALRLYGVMERRLTEFEYLAGDYSIADMAVFPWLDYYEKHFPNLQEFPNLKGWFNRISSRQAVQKGMQILQASGKPLDEKARKILFG